MPTSEASAQRECHSSWQICRWYGREVSAGSERAQAPLLFLSLASPALSSHLRPPTSGSFLCPSKWSLRSVALPKAHFLHHWLAPCQAATPPHLWGVTVGWATPLGSGFSKSRVPSLALFLLHRMLQAHEHSCLLLRPSIWDQTRALLGLPNLCLGQPVWLSHSFNLK